ncbi:MAG: crossover junction endodeoxyribonuclease RuvC [Planctomycetota bacterium]|nr:MAG: crossover junction endodeoxyribonuclease RuvC [Planctomycetota bacterium]
MDELPRTAVRILGIDPGLNTTGYGCIEAAGGSVRVVEAGVVRGRTRGSLAGRVREIYAGVRDAIAALRPSAVALEQLYSHYARPRTAILMGHARGVICLAAAEAEVAVVHYPATQIKKVLTGNGRAPKAQMQRAIQLELKLPTLPEPADVADALAVALTHHYLRSTRGILEAGTKRRGNTH